MEWCEQNPLSNGVQNSFIDLYAYFLIFVSCFVFVSPRRHDSFYVSVCSSPGAILGFMLGIFQYPLSECEDMYRKLGSDVFKQNRLVGTVKMGWNHAFYDSEPWEKILK